MILRATQELLAERGMSGVTISAVAAHAHVSRGTVYLRWANRHHLIIAAVRSAMGELPVLTGDFEADVRLIVEDLRSALERPTFREVLPAFVAVITDPGDESRSAFDTLVPVRNLVADEYASHPRDPGACEGLPGALVVDLAVGGVFTRLFATGTAPTREEADLMTRLVLEGARCVGEAGSLRMKGEVRVATAVPDPGEI